jgi:hypothetical protein
MVLNLLHLDLGEVVIAPDVARPVIVTEPSECNTPRGAMRQGGIWIGWPGSASWSTNTQLLPTVGYHQST